LFSLGSPFGAKGDLFSLDGSPPAGGLNKEGVGFEGFPVNAGGFDGWVSCFPNKLLASFS